MSAVHDLQRREAALLAQWRADPVSFVQFHFGLGRAVEYVEPLPGEPVLKEYLDWFQEEGLEALPTEDRICFLANKGPGKTAWEAWAIWWFMACHPLCNGAAVSYTGEQLSANLWKELRKWQQRSPYLKERFEWTAQKIKHREFPDEWWFEARSWPKTASPDEQATALAGLHADAIMCVMDESGAIPVGVLVTAEAILANKIHAHQVAKVIQAGNPTTLDGALYHAASKHRSKWWVREITGDPEDPKRARRVSRQWAADMIREHGREHPFVRINVLGKFPLEQSNALISRAAVQEAMRRELPSEAYSYAPKIIGVDPARFGEDRTVIVKRQGRAVLDEVKVMRGRDEAQIAGEVARIIVDWKADRCFVDDIGVGGGVVTILRHSGFEKIVVGVNSSRRDGVKAGFYNQRIEMWDRMREWIATGRLPQIDGLEDELSLPTYEYRAADNKMLLEDKDEMRKRLGKSPDIADAIAFTFAGPVPLDEAHTKLARRERQYGKAQSVRDIDSWRKRI